MAIEALTIGPFEKRAARAISNVVLYDLVQDMARVIDTIPARLDQHEVMLKQILEKLDAS